MKSILVGNTQLLAGGPETIDSVLTLLKKHATRIKGNPDLYVRSYKSFGIDEARELRDRAALRPAHDKRRIFVLAMADMTREAQNALLKTIEEPPANALFFFIISSPETMLSTFRSRAHIISLERTELRGIIDTLKFVAAQPQKRLDMLKPLLEKDEDDKRDLGAVLSFLASLEALFAKKPDYDAVSAIYRARKFASDKGALIKPLLEQVALLTPRS